MLGVFGTARIIKDHELLLPRHDDPTANKAHLLQSEATLTTLGALDRAKIDRHAALYRAVATQPAAPRG